MVLEPQWGTAMFRMKQAVYAVAMVMVVMMAVEEAGAMEERPMSTNNRGERMSVLRDTSSRAAAGIMSFFEGCNVAADLIHVRVLAKVLVTLCNTRNQKRVIKPSRECERDLKKLIQWFDNHWDRLLPYLPYVHFGSE
jgi:hypothetical protein